MGVQRAVEESASEKRGSRKEKKLSDGSASGQYLCSTSTGRGPITGCRLARKSRGGPGLPDLGTPFLDAGLPSDYVAFTKRARVGPGGASVYNRQLSNTPLLPWALVTLQAVIEWKFQP